MKEMKKYLVKGTLSVSFEVRIDAASAKKAELIAYEDMDIDLATYHKVDYNIKINDIKEK